MKRLQNLWPQLIAFDNLWQAWRQARRGKSRSVGAVAFELNLECELLALQRELADGGYQPRVSAIRPRLRPRPSEPCGHQSQRPSLARPRPPRRHVRFAPKSLQCGIFYAGSGPIGGPLAVRGGAWNNKPARVRSANRNRDDPANRNNNQGFRLASPPAFQSRRVHGCGGREARVIMSPLPGLAGTGAPNSFVRDDWARGRRIAEGSASFR